MRENIPDNIIDLTITSPPYDNLRKYNGFVFDYKSMLKELYRTTKDGGIVVWIVGDKTENGTETLTSFKQALYAKEIGFNIHDTMIYEKMGCGACGSNKAYIQNFEYMFVFTKGKIKTYNLLYDRTNAKQSTTITNGQRTVFNADTQRKYRTITTEKMGRRFNIWKYDQRNNQDNFHLKHPAPFPEQLAQDHILSWSNEGDIVFDPMCGSGTTCKEAYLLHRNFIGIDMSEEYINNICIPRLEQYGWNKDNNGYIV